MGFRLRLPSRTQISRWTIYALFAGLFISLPAGVITAPKAYAASCNPTSTTIGSETILTFSATGNCDWTAPAGVSSVRVLVVGGGGSGGGGYTARYFGNGGGGGEVIETTTTISQGATISIAVGSGGVGPNYDTNSTSVNNGANSSFQSITARGGTSTFDKNSRVGGTSGSQKIGGTGGNTATEGGGGGGAGAAGSTRNGGAGVTSNISGSSVEYGGGGAAMGYGSAPEYGTASGGGGVPATYSTNVKGNGVNGRGGGGGGDNGVAGGGAGGSGVVIVRYTVPGQCTSTTSTVDTQTVITFTSVQNCDWSVPFGVSSVRVLVVGGGGGGAGGISGVYFGAGGGGGEVISNNTYATTPGGTIAVTVGGGGLASAYSTTYTGDDLLARHGSSSIFGNLTARGGKAPTNANSIGGASGNANAGGNNAGGTWGNAGGGASAAANGGAPGAGVTSNISGTSLEYGGGGDGTNGAGSGSARPGAGSQTAVPLANRGGGGAVLVSANYGGSAGGSGVVIVRFTTVVNTNPILYFNSNGGSGSVAAQSETAGATVTLPSGSGFTKRNSAFTGWNTAANGSGTDYAAGDSFTLNSNTTLYAQWSGPVLASDLASPQCVGGVGKGGSPSPSALPPTKGGNGCVVVSYISSGTTAFKTFNYTGATQNWTVPAGVTSATFYLIGAGGGGVTQGTGTGTGGGGGFARGTVAVSAGSVFEIIVGEAGGGVAPTNSGSCSYTPRTFGGGGKGGACYQLRTGMMASGGGRSAVRVSGAANDLITAGGGGGGGYQGVGGAGGGLVGQSGTINTTPGGSQTAGGAGGYSINGFPGLAGTKYQGGDSRDESGGGGGGSSFYDTLTVTSGSTSAGSLTTPGTSTGLFNIITYDANGATSGSAPAPSQFTVTGGTRTLETNTAGLTRTGYTLTGWNTQADGRGASYNLADLTFNTSTDITLYAEWSYKVTYNANGATSGTAPAAVTVTGDSTTTLAINPGVLAITRGVLRGWNTEADGSGTAYPGGQTNFSYDGNVTLYAMWGPASCTPTEGYTNCAVFPMNQGDLFYKLPNNVPVGTIMQAEVWGAGGGVNESSPTGGGGGGYSRVQIEVKAVGETFTVVTGKGGSRGDTVGTYGGGGGTSRNSYWGSSGGGMSGIFSGEGLDNPIVISGGGGGASPGHAVGIAGGGGAAGNPGNQRGNASDYAIAGAPGTLSAGGAAATNTSPCNGENATAGSRYQGGRGAGGNTANGTESGGGGGGGYYGGGGGRCQVSSGPVQNGGGGGGSGYYDSSRVTLVEVVNGSNAIAGAGPTGGTASAQYITGVGLGGGVSNSGAAGNGLVVLQWGTETYTVTFNGNGGTTTAASVSQTVVGGKVTVADSSTATRTGFTFLGWNTLANGTGTAVAVGPGYLPPSNITLYAKWSANSYLVVFDSNTATGVAATGTMANMAIVAGTAKALTTNGFARTGYVFRNWNSRADGTGTTYANLASITFYETTTVYAQWNPILTYLINGGSGTVPVAVNNPPGTNVAAASSTITRTGFTFAGWNTAANRSGTSYAVGDSITVTTPLNLYAQWKLTVTYNGNTPTTGSVPAAAVINEFSAATIPGNTGLLVKTGYIFVGWNTVIGGTGTRYLAGETFTPTANITLYADWIVACSPTTSYGNGDQLASMKTAGTCAYAIPAGVSSIDFLVVGGGGGGGTNAGSGGGGGGLVYRTGVPVTPGQVLIVTTGAGGGTGANGNPSMVVIGGVEYRGRAGAGGVTYRPSSTCSSVRTLGGEGAYANGALGGNGAGNNLQNGCAGDNGTALSISGTSITYGSGGGGGGYGGAGGIAGTSAGNGGANFVGGGAGVANTGGGGGGGGAGNGTGGAGGSGVVVIAFDYISTINYDSNTATSGSVTTTTWTQSYIGESLTIQGKGTLAKLGYSFTGWNTAANGSGTMYQPSEIVAPQGPTTYYAIWVADTFTVTFDANGGTGSIPGVLYTAGVAKALTSNTTQITRTGFTFGGWTTNADGSGTSYTNAQSITLYAGITLYAKWSANTYTVFFGSNTATGPSTMPNQSFQAGTPFKLNTSLWYKTGYDFAGWSATSGTQAILYTQNQTVTLYANTNIYAQWSAKVFAVTYNNNGGTGSASVTSQNYTYGSAAITSFATIGAMTRTGYTFGGWATTAGGTTALTTLTPTADQTLYAIWTAKSFNIVFNGNTSTSGSMSNLAMVSGVAKVLTENSFVKTGFAFEGWNTSSSGNGISYQDLQSVTIFSDTTTVTFYAKWSELKPATPAISSVVSGNESVTVSVTSGSVSCIAPFTLTAGNCVYKNTTVGPATVTIPANVTSIEVLVVGGGASGGWVGNAAGGGAGGLLYNPSFTVAPSTTISINVGAGGTAVASGTGNNGGNSTFGSFTATGGGAGTGGSLYIPGVAGGSGGGAGSPGAACTVTIGGASTQTSYSEWVALGNAGGIGCSTTVATSQVGGGGGGAGGPGLPTTVGSLSYTGGPGVPLSISGTTVTYAAGGNGDTYAAPTVQPAGTAGTGNGGGAGSAGGSGVVIMSYAPSAGTATSYTVTALDASGNPVPGPLTCTVTAPATSCSISGLTNGTAYKYSVTANNATGSSVETVTSTTSTPQPYVVTYSVVNGGTVSPATANFDMGSPVTMPLPVRAGYTFTGWFTSASGGTLLSLNGAGYSPPGNITVYAQWTGISYPITYNSNGGSSTVPTNGSYSTGGSAYAIAAAPVGMTKSGYTFAGWNTLSTGLGTDYAASASYSTSAALTLFAKWSAINYTITYANSGSGTGTLPTRPALTIGQTFAVASGSALSNTGYSFTGWTDGTNTYVSGESYTVGSTDITLTAVWTPLQYLVLYSANGGTGVVPTSPTRSAGQTFAVESGTALSRTGYTFSGWAESGTVYSHNQTFTMPAANITFLAQWNPEVFTVTYVAGLGSGSASRTSDSFNYGGSAISLPTVGTMVRAGYVFAGWAETTTVISGTYTPTRSETLTAQWSPGTYAITYNTNGATGSPTGAPSSYTTSGNGLALPGSTGMSNPGYTLVGWSTSPTGSAISSAFMPTANTTLYAIWTPAQVAINFTAGEVAAGTSSGATISTTSLTQTFNSQYTLPSIDSPTVTISSQVYAFTGWKASNGTNYAAGSSYTVEAAGTTFTAQWIQQFVVTYVLNGGAVAAGDATSDNECVNAGNMCNDQQIISTNSSPSRNGYNFTGWVDQGGTSVAASASYTVSVGHYVLSAQWTPVSVNLSYSAAGGSTTPSTQTGSYLSSVTLASAINQTGYTFAGWSDGTHTYGAGANYRIDTSSSITFTAQWVANIHTVSYDLNQGTSGTSLNTSSHNYGAAITITSVIPQRTGYQFTGWIYSSNTYESTTAFSMPDLDVTFTAQWSAASYPVTYALNGGNSAPPTQSAVAFGSTFTVAAVPTNPDSTVNFLGWSDGTNVVAAGSTYTMPVGGVTLTAQWSGALIGVTYTVAGATSGVAPATEIVAPGTTVTVAPTTGISRTRFTLEAWSTGNTTLEPSSTIAPVANTTLAAVWAPAAPDAPIETLTASSGSVTIGVSQGPGVGGIPTSFTVTAIDSITGQTAGSCEVISPATSCTIAGLTNGTAYNFSTVATNSTGSSTPNISGPLTPATVPSAPTSPAATIEDSKATVSFTAPANTVVGTGGSPITSYMVTAYAPDGVTVAGTCTATPPATSCLVTGLTNGTAYTYAVVANNALGSSAASPQSAAVTPATVPGAPATVSASAASATSATITIGAATVTGGSTITAYDITATPIGGGTPVTLTVTAAQIASGLTLSGLAPGTQYSITSNATNAVGDGATTSAGSTITTPAEVPGAPAISSANATSSTSANISITAPTSNGGAVITEYSTTFTPLGGGNAITETSTGTSVTTNSLAPGTTYQVTTSATNSSGPGATSTSTTFTTPLGVTTSTANATGQVGSAINPISTSISGASPTNTTYSISGALPAGLSFDTATGVISGTPTFASGSTTYTITATTTVAGGAVATGTATLTLGVSPNVPGAPASVSASAVTSTTASVTLGASTDNGGATIDSYTVTVSPVVSGSIGTSSPVASAIGSAISVTGLTPGTEYSVSAVATNVAGSGAATTALTTIITPSALTPSTSSASGSVNTAITPVTIALTSSGSISTVYSITGPLPAGLSIDSATGTISGTSLVAINPTQFTITAVTTLSSGATTTGTAVITLGISPVAPSAPVSATATIPSGSSTTAAIAITPPATSGGATVETYTVTAIPVLSGISVSATSSTTSPTISGLQPGTQYTASVTATNSAGASAATSTSTFITNPAITTSVSSATGAVNTVLTPITTTLLAEAGSTATYSISGSLPAGLIFDTATGTISGTPTTVTASASYTITAVAEIAGVTMSASASVNLGVTYSAPEAPQAATGSVASGATTTAIVSITAPTSNGGESIDSYTVTVTPVVSGSPITATSASTTANLTGLAPGTQYTAVVAAVNAAGAGPTATTSIFITNPGVTTSLTSTTEAVGVAMTPISTSVLSELGTSSTFTINGQLPAGLVFDPATGTISGTPTSITAVDTFTITASVLIGGVTKTASTDVTIGVVASPQATLVLSGSSGTVGTPISTTTSGGSGTGSVTYAVIDGTATGCSIDSQGDITATSAGTCFATATKAGDSNFATATSAQLTVTFAAISAPTPPTPAPTPPTPAPTPPTPAPTPIAVAPTPSPTPSPSPTPTPSVTPTPSPTPSVTPAPSPSASPAPTSKPSPKPTPKPSTSPKATPAPSPAATPAAKPTPKPSDVKPPLAIKPSATGDKAKVGLENLKPGQKIKVTVKEGAVATAKPTAKPSQKATSKATPKPAPSKSFTPTSKKPVSVVPKPSGNSAGFGISNLKPGQKIKVTVKTGGNKK